MNVVTHRFPLFRTLSRAEWLAALAIVVLAAFVGSAALLGRLGPRDPREQLDVYHTPLSCNLPACLPN